MPNTQTTCIVCNTSGHDVSVFHQITYERSKDKADELSLAERVCKLLKINDIYSSSQGLAHPLMMCTGCLQEMTKIEDDAKAKKKFKKSFKKSLGNIQSVDAGCRRDRKRSGQNSGNRGHKEKKLNYDLSSSDLELCVKEIDELITHVLQDELMSKGKASGDKKQDSGLLSTELAILKETFSEMEKELGNFESPSKTSGSARHATESVIRELLMKHRITEEYKDKLVQHLNKMVSYISKHKSKFECNAAGLQKFCRILEIVYSQGSREEEIDIGDDSSSSSSCSSINITLSLMESVNNIFNQSAAQIASAWREASGNSEVSVDQPPKTVELSQTAKSPQTAKSQTAKSSPPKAKRNQTAGSLQSTNLPPKTKPPQVVEPPQGTEPPHTVTIEKPEVPPATHAIDEEVIGSQIHKIINGENEDDIIDIESIGSDESDKPQTGVQKSSGENDKESERKKMVDEESGEASSSSSTNQHGPMVIGDTTDEEEEEESKKLNQSGKSGIKIEKKQVPSSQDDIQEIEQAKKDAPVLICIDSDDDDDDETKEKDAKTNKTSNDQSEKSSQESSMLSYEETRWKHLQEKRSDCFIVSQTTPPPSQNRPTQQDNSNSKSGGVKLPRNFSVTGVVYGDMINNPQSSQGQPESEVESASTGMRSAPAGTKLPRYSSVTGVVCGNMVSEGQQRLEQPKQLAFKGYTSSASPAKDHFGHWQQQNFSGYGRKKFNFNKKMKHKKQWNFQGMQQGNMNAPNANRKKQKFQFKGKKFKPYLNPTESVVPSKLDIIPVISGRVQNKQTPPNVQNIQGGPQNSTQGNPSGGNVPVNQSKKKKFKLKKKGKQKRQHHYNPGSKPVGKTVDGTTHQSNSSFKLQKINQPPVMRVLGDASHVQAVKVKANWQ